MPSLVAKQQGLSQQRLNFLHINRYAFASMVASYMRTGRTRRGTLLDLAQWVPRHFCLFLCHLCPFFLSLVSLFLCHLPLLALSRASAWVYSCCLSLWFRSGFTLFRASARVFTPVWGLGLGLLFLWLRPGFLLCSFITVSVWVYSCFLSLGFRSGFTPFRAWLRPGFRVSMFFQAYLNFFLGFRGPFTPLSLGAFFHSGFGLC